MSITVKALSEGLPFGSRVAGLTETIVQDEDIRAQLRQLFEERGMIVFEEVEPCSSMQVALSEVFGPLKEHPVAAVPLVDSDQVPGIIEVRFSPESGDIVEIDGTPYSSWLPWHFDHCYNNELNRAGVLRLVKSTPNGGETCFMDGIDLYNAIAPELLARIEGRSVIYSLDMQPDHIRFGRLENFRVLQVDPTQLEILEQHKTYPRAIHPAVWTRASGEKILHYSPWMAEGIEGMDESEAAELLEAVAREINRLVKTRRYAHQWKPTDLLIWDNWRMLHSVTGCTPPHARTIYRSTIRGDYGLGRFENNDKGRYEVLEMTV